MNQSDWERERDKAAEEYMNTPTYGRCCFSPNFEDLGTKEIKKEHPIEHFSAFRSGVNWARQHYLTKDPVVLALVKELQNIDDALTLIFKYFSGPKYDKADQIKQALEQYKKSVEI